MRAFSLRLAAPEPRAYWEGVAAKQPHETFDLGGGEGAQVSLSNFAEIDVVFFHLFVRFNAVGACAEHLCSIQFTVLVAFDELRAVFLGWSHVFLVQQDVYWGEFNFVAVGIYAHDQVRVLCRVGDNLVSGSPWTDFEAILAL